MAPPPVDGGPIGRLGEGRLDSERDEAFACLTGRAVSVAERSGEAGRFMIDSITDGIRTRLEQELQTAVSRLRPLDGAVAVYGAHGELRDETGDQCP